MKEVVCALIIHNGKLLVVQHGPGSGHPWKWEFPGGKIQPGESPEAALVREVNEELNILINIHAPLKPVDHFYEDRTIRLIPFLCSWDSGKLACNEHVDHRWITPGEVFVFDMLAADYQMLKEGGNLEELIRFAQS